MNKILSLIAASFVSVASFAQVAPSKGDGSLENPYKIGSADELLWFAQQVNDDAKLCAELVADIDMSTVCGKEKGAWTPIGVKEHIFSGVFDGNGHSVSNLYINGTTHYQGLFGIVSGARIQNLTIASGTITSKYGSTGAVVGYASSTVIENCHNYTNVSCVKFAGGIIGYLSKDAVVTRCHNEGAISSGDDWGSGGIAGATSDATVDNCYNLGVVSGESRVGGIVGSYERTSVVKNCYSIGANKGSRITGPIIGYEEASNSAVYTNCYFNSVSFSSSVDAAKNVTLDQFKSGEITYLLNNDTLVWYQTIGEDAIPVLDPTHYVVLMDTANMSYFNDIPVVPDTIVPVIPDTIVPEDPYVGFGEGTVEIPFRISNADELLWFAQHVDSGNTNACGVVVADIDMSTVCGKERGTWNPIGNTKNRFSGVFDGNGHSITNLYVNGTTNYQGLFGVVENARIQNLTIASGTVTSKAGSTGSIAGYATNTVIDNCHNYTNVSCVKFAGGIVGYLSKDAEITRCHNEGAISSGDDWGSGGIAGATSDGTVNNCYNLGVVSGESRVGGIVGSYEKASVVKNCYSIGANQGSRITGPIIGFEQASSDAVFTNCYFNSISFSSSTDAAKNVTLTQFKSGEITYLLNQDQDVVWYQTINVDERPLFDSSRGIVKYDSIKNIYVGLDDVVANEGVNVYVVSNTVNVVGAESFRVYNIFGMDVTNLNGNLSNGIYVVIAGDNSFKVVVK